jgi:hypothetical protein
MKKLYIIGSLRNPSIKSIAASIREALPTLDVFDDWISVGPEADDHWMTYERGRGRTYVEALRGRAAKHVFKFDKTHLDTSCGALMVLPAGRSAHLELGYMAGRGMWTGILLDNPDPERWDVMYGFAGGVYQGVGEVVDALRTASQGQRLAMVPVPVPPGWPMRDPNEGWGNLNRIGGTQP